MILLCIDNKGYEKELSLNSLHIGYFAVGNSCYTLYLPDNRGYGENLLRERFKVISESNYITPLIQTLYGDLR